MENTDKKIYEGEFKINGEKILYNIYPNGATEFFHDNGDFIGVGLIIEIPEFKECIIHSPTYGDIMYEDKLSAIKGLYVSITENRIYPVNVVGKP